MTADSGHPQLPPQTAGAPPAPLAAEPPALVAAETAVQQQAVEAELGQQADKAAASRAAAKATAEARTPDQIRADIAATREELARTVDALAAKLDVKTRAQGELVKARTYAADPANRPQLVAAAVGFLAVLALWLGRTRKKSRR